jgi:hypothetical protein
MIKRTTTLTAAAGEHYVAYRLSQLGYAVALTRAGTPLVDLMVASQDGNAVSVQVKTSSAAYFTHKDRAKNYWNWDVGEKARHARGESLFYAFVDLKGSADGASPDVFIVPAADVADFVQVQDTRIMFWVMEKDKDRYLERWDFITARLTSGGTARGTAAGQS